jgi:hypothetical protein
MHDGFYSKTVKLTDRYLRILKNTTSCGLLIELPLLLGACDAIILILPVLSAIINHAGSATRKRSHHWTLSTGYVRASTMSLRSNKRECFSCSCLRLRGDPAKTKEYVPVRGIEPRPPR